MADKNLIPEPIAIVGSGCRFAGGATSPSKLWELLSHPIDLTRKVPSDRFNVDGFYHPNGEYHGTTNAPKAYFLDQDHRVFDASFFSISMKEAEAIDPQQRLVLEVVYEALDSAGYTLEQYAGRKVAVFAGLMTADYDTLSQRDDLMTSQYYATGNARSIVANRVSYFFNFNGPSMTIDTACSSSLVALHQAVLSLRSGECEMACVTGANLILTPEQFVVESSLHMLSATGHCRMWDANADGYARGEGVAALFIKPLSKALADGDRIEAIIRQTGVNSDGRSKGITMPNWKAQSELIQDTYRRAGLDSRNPLDRCQYFEAHGTGTKAGDPNEARAIEDAFFGGSSDSSRATVPSATTQKLLVGSVKTVIGHTEGAAGLAGLLKVVHAMHHDAVPPNLHLDHLNPDVEKFYTNLLIPTSVVSWPHIHTGQVKRASVNSFGFGGTNSHAIVEQYIPDIHDSIAKLFAPQLELAINTGPHCCADKEQIRLPLLLSANSQTSLAEVAKGYRDYLVRHQSLHIQDVAWHTYAHRTAFNFRASVSGNSMGDLLKNLDALIDKAEKMGPAAISTRARPQIETPKILGIFTGQGAQWATMSRGLLLTSETYAKSIRSMDNILQACPHPPSWSLEQEILADVDISRVQKAAISQPVSTALQVALVDLLHDLGITFSAVVGHSSGEIAAAYAAGRLKMREAILISYYRGMYAHLASGANGEKGAMLAAGISKEEAAEICAKQEYRHGICVAASNAPSIVTLSGDYGIVERVHNDLVQQQKFSRMLLVDTAYHSPHMEAPAVKYLEALDACGIHPTDVEGDTTWISSVYGFGEPSSTELRSSYWKDNMVKPVLFYEALSTVLENGSSFDCAIEVSPHPTLRGPATKVMKKILGEPIPYSALLDRNTDDRVAFAEFLGWMWTHFGSSLSQIRQFVLGSVQPGLVRARLHHVPLYPWNHSVTHYRESRISRQYHFRNQPPHELLGVRTRDDNDFELRWRNILHLHNLPWVKGHSFQGQALLPASAYCIMALDAARVLLAGRPASTVELFDIDFWNGIILELDSPGVEVLFSLSVSGAPDDKDPSSPIEATFSLTSVIADGSTSMKKSFSGKVRIVLGEASPHALPSRPQDRAETLHASPESFYAMMAGTGLDYTGPFQGLKSLHRRINFASATAQKYHPEDTTNLSISPATLDSCLQTSFVTVSSPGDMALWTSFLPEKIERVCFNLAVCDITDKANGDELSVDTYLTNTRPISRDSAASFTADIEIFDKHGHMEIQVEGLTVCSWSSTKAPDDYELYLTTVMDVDPEDEIISASMSDLHQPSAILVESCERVASFYIRLAAIRHMCHLAHRVVLPAGYQSDAHVAMNAWPKETEESLEKFIRASPYYTTLDFIRRLGENLPDVLAGMLPTVIEEAHQFMGFQKHVSRVVRQIAHKYPRMNILGLTDPELGLAEHVLAGLGNSFLTYRVGAKPEKNLEARINPSEVLRKKIMVDKIDLDSQLEAVSKADQVQYDLVILTTSLIQSNQAQHTLRSIRGMMRPGAFLVLIHVSCSPLKDRLRRCAGYESQDAQVLTPPDWFDALDDSGFGHANTNSHQFYPPGFSFTVRQAESHEKLHLLRPLVHRPDVSLTDRLLVIGGKQLWTSLISSGVCQTLASHCGSITAVETLDQIATEHVHHNHSKPLASSFSAVILLGDIDEPVLASMTATRLEALRALLRPNMVLLWVTHNARFYNPDHAASFGFGRTLIAETPNLLLQMLDLDTIDTCPAVTAISEAFARLAIHSLVQGSEDKKPLWVHEPEVHIEEGHRLVPRVLPWKEGIERVNANRRVVTHEVNTLEKMVEIVPAHSADGEFKYTTKVNPIDLHNPSSCGGSIRVDFSAVDILKLGGDFSSYVSIGRDIETGKALVALSEANASYITTSSPCVTQISHEPLNQPLFLALLVRYLTALTIANTVQDKPIVLVEPDQMLQDCAKDIFVKRGIWFRICSTDAKRCSLTSGMIYVHPKSSAREVKSLYPPGGAWILDLLPQSSKISELLARSLPKDCIYNSRSSVLATQHTKLNQDSTFAESIWSEAVALALSRSKSPQTEVELRLMSVPDLLQVVKPTPPFQILDWKAERLVSHVIDYAVEKNTLWPDKTYILVGLTRDFGQSLCNLFVQEGARHIVLASRNPPKQHPKWQDEMLARGINIRFEVLDVTNLDNVLAFKSKLAKNWPPVGGVVNGAMILEDRVFSEMSVETLHRVMNPKTIGSKNLDIAFDSAEMDFFIMSSSFAAIGGHAGQSNYAAANMYMNGLAASRRRRGLAGSVLNIGVIYGLGFLHREKAELYDGLQRDGYRPISERDIHHMFVEAIVAGRPTSGQIYDIVTGLNRYDADNTTLPWQVDPRFSHYTLPESEQEREEYKNGVKKQSVKELLQNAHTETEVQDVLVPAFINRLERLLQIPPNTITGDTSVVELGVDSLVAVEIRSWIWKAIAQDVAVMKIMGAHSIKKLCKDITHMIMGARNPPAPTKPALLVNGDSATSDLNRANERREIYESTHVPLSRFTTTTSGGYDGGSSGVDSDSDGTLLTSNSSLTKSVVASKKGEQSEA
ncbi:putative polyketide synthase [Cercophora scortea]|uniref:Polyketide synthase n=1 Tax=Cercophora scortea TaxID=314031 RepID=A0AAE0M2U7_9PEZI|nr:putative polyketide synthase [Cercophora scortea]